jgi:hypothetical protein
MAFNLPLFPEYMDIMIGKDAYGEPACHEHEKL